MSFSTYFVETWEIGNQSLVEYNNSSMIYIDIFPLIWVVHYSLGSVTFYGLGIKKKQHITIDMYNYKRDFQLSFLIPHLSFLCDPPYLDYSHCPLPSAWQSKMCPITLSQLQPPIAFLTSFLYFRSQMSHGVCVWPTVLRYLFRFTNNYMKGWETRPQGIWLRYFTSILFTYFTWK